MKISEASIQETCTAWLELDGWRALRTDPVSDRSRGKGFGELGMADMLYIRYGCASHFHGEHIPGRCADAETFWIEYKRERGGNGKKALYTRAEKAKIHQRAWIEAERARGALVLLVGEDCRATIEGVMCWYIGSGLLRNRSLGLGVQREVAAG